jgi:uncharacterized protein (DUF2141 family)
MTGEVYDHAMRFKGLVALLFLLVSFETFPRALAADDQHLAKLTVRVVDLRNHNGDLIFGVFKQPEGFPSTKDKSVNWQVKPASADAVEFTAELPPGKYSASVLHDENRNSKMDRDGAGIPLEGYGVSNNPKPRLRAATFKEAQFDLPQQGATITISVQYFR